MPIYKICCVCLRTDFELLNLDGTALELFQEFCGKTRQESQAHIFTHCATEVVIRNLMNMYLYAHRIFNNVFLLLNYSSMDPSIFENIFIAYVYQTGNTSYFCCLFCLHLLKKFSCFKNKCQLSYDIFENWKCTKNQTKPALSDLHKSIPLSTYGIFTPDPLKDINITEETQDIDITVKVEKYEENQGDDIHVDDNEYANDDDKDDDLNDNDTDDDKCLINFVKVKNKKGVRIKKKKSEIQSLDNPETNPKKQKLRKPLKDHKEYESVFDIQLFRTDAEIRQEFAARKTCPRYMAAPYKCDICYTVYKCQKLAEFHMKWHLPSAGEFPCDVCAMRFKSHSVMRKHKADVHFGRFACKKCPLITYHKMVMILHYRKHQGVSYVCKICNKTFNHSSTYMSHLRKSHRTEHVCVTCAQTFVSEKGLSVHRKKVHNASSKFDANATARCTQCDLTFANQQVYTVHIMNTDKHKDKAEALIACPECGIQFPDKLAVRAHRREMHPQYNFSAMKRAESGQPLGQICPLCGASGTHNTWLYRHFLASHPTHNYEQCVASERRRHLCDQCGKSFYNITQLKEHAFAHAGLKPFRCDKCPAAFSSKSHLKFHSERHAPPRRECSECGKKFVSSANLSNHMRSHIGDRRYKCSLCGKGFLHCAALREHVRGVHLHIRRQRKCK